MTHERIRYNLDDTTWYVILLLSNVLITHGIGPPAHVHTPAAPPMTAVSQVRGLVQTQRLRRVHPFRFSVTLTAGKVVVVDVALVVAGGFSMGS